MVNLPTILKTVYSLCIGIEIFALSVMCAHWFSSGIFLDTHGYVFFTVFLCSACAAFFFAPRDNLKVRTLCHCIIVVLLAIGFFKTTIYDYRSLVAWNAITILVLAAIVIQSAFKPLHHWVCLWWSLMIDAHYQRKIRGLLDFSFVLFILALIIVPDVEAVVARMFIGEQFHHIDNFLMAQIWTTASGGRVNVDTVSQYGLGLPVVIAFLSQWMGSLSYESVVTTVMGLICVYYVGMYVFLRQWLRSIPLSMAAWCAGFKIQMFYTLSYPCILTYPQGSVVRGFLDVSFFLCLLMYWRYGKKVMLYSAVVLAGISAWLVTSTGIYLIAALGAVIFLEELNFNSGKWISAKPFMAVGGSVLTFALLSWLTVGNAILDPQFWNNTKDFIKIFTTGYFSAPFWGLMEYQQFWDLIVACALMMVLLLSVVYGLWAHLKGTLRREDLLIIPISLYGLGLFEHWITMTLGNNYYSKALPFVWVLFWWIRQFQLTLKPQWQRILSVSLFGATVFALLTNHHAMSYPNLLNVSRNPMTDLKTIAQPLPTGYPYFFHKYRQFTEDRKLPTNNLGETNEGILSEYDFPNDAALKRYYRHENDFSIDVALIARLTQKEEKVVLLSSFEVSILMQAQRKPFFFVFPFLESRPMRMRFFETDQLFTQQQLDQILNQLRTAQPSYIFMERIFLNRNYPARYKRDTPGLLGVLDYVFANYKLEEEGQYLVAMRRR